jgi:putative PIN family toxin of toxin-antitoxin system
MRVILDTNIWISYLFSKKLNWIDQLIKEENTKLLFSKRLFTEFIYVANRPKLKPYVKKEEIEGVISLFSEYGLMIKTKSIINKCRDPNDNFLLELAIDGEADYLVSGDKDLLIIKKIKNCQIITLRQLRDIVEM